MEVIMNTRAFILSALIAGAVMALLGNLPIINFFNCVLCMWVWLSSILAVFLYRRFATADPTLSMGQSAGLGAVSGVIGALIGAGISAIFTSSGMAGGLDALKSQPALAPYVDMITSKGFTFISLIIDLVLYSAFGALGGIIATGLIWKKPKTT
jgi:hypothetical protein